MCYYLNANFSAAFIKENIIRKYTVFKFSHFLIFLMMLDFVNAHLDIIM